MCQVSAGTCLCSSCPRGHFVGPGVCKTPGLSCRGLHVAGLPAIAPAATVKCAWAGVTHLVTNMLRGGRREVARHLTVRPDADGALLPAENGACRMLTLQRAGAIAWVGGEVARWLRLDGRADLPVQAAGRQAKAARGLTLQWEAS